MLSHVWILAGCGLNVESLIICGTEKWDLCYMCILRSRQDHVVEQACQMLEDFMCSHSPASLLILLPPHVLVYVARTSQKWVWSCTNHSLLKCLFPRLVNWRAFEQASTHRACWANNWVIIFWKCSSNSTWSEETRPIWAAAQKQAQCDGHMESAHSVGLSPVCKETSVISTSLSHWCMWPDFKLKFKKWQ